MDRKEATEIMLQIAIGDFDDELDRIATAVNNRRRLLRDGEAAETLATLEKYDVVKLSDDCTPQYLRGAQAVVSGFKDGKVNIRMMETRSRGNKSFRRGTVVLCPASIIRPLGYKDQGFEDMYA